MTKHIWSLRDKVKLKRVDKKKCKFFGKYPGKYFWKAHKKGGGEDGKEGINLLTLHPKRKIF